MSRIRSVHPGLWTDEVFVSLSPFARLLFMGIWNECDDMGSFEWSPLKLKMRILPADNLDAPATLAEIEAAGCVMRYEHGGKSYGAVRNFCQYQRPKKPNSTCPQTEEVRRWVNTDARSTRDGSPPVGNDAPTGGERDRQRKEEGGRMDEGSPEADASAAGDSIDPEKIMFDTGRAFLAKSGVPHAKAGGLLGKWKRDHGAEAVIVALGKAQRHGAIDPTSFIEGCLRNGQRTRDDRTSGWAPLPGMEGAEPASLDDEGIGYQARR